MEGWGGFWKRGEKRGESGQDIYSESFFMCILSVAISGDIHLVSNTDKQRHATK